MLAESPAFEASVDGLLFGGGGAPARIARPRTVTKRQGTPSSRVLFINGMAGRFARTMQLTIGGVPKSELIRQLQSVRKINPVAEELLQHSCVTTRTEYSRMNLLMLSHEELGLPYFGSTEWERVFDPTFRAQWSGKNLRGAVLGECPAEVAIWLAIWYKQVAVEALRVVMRRLSTSEFRERAFSVERMINGQRWLTSDLVALVPVVPLYVFVLEHP